jgi:hypothetical protein
VGGRINPLSAAGLIGIGGLNLILMGAIGSILWEDEATGDVRAWSPPLTTSSIDVAAIKPIAAYHFALAQPLFFKSRQPFVPPPPSPQPIAASPPPPAPAVPVDPGLALGGVIVTKQVRKAYVFNRSNAQGSWVGEGEQASGWSVQSIDQARAVLRKDGRTLELLLYPAR